jgi:hypothetical protein
MLFPICSKRLPVGIDGIFLTDFIWGRVLVNQNANSTSRLENILSLSILLVLAAIAAVIFLQQFRYSAAILKDDPILSSPAGRPASAKTEPVSVLKSFPQNLLPLSPAEVFGPSNLSDKINGKAGLYLSAGFKRLESQRFKTDKDSTAWMEVFVYDMGNTENAFSVFSAQRRDDEKPADLGQFSYRTQNALYWIHGPYYLEIIGSTATEENAAAMQLFAETFNRHIKVETESMAERDLFPSAGLDPKSIALIADNAFGYEGFDRVYIAGYNIDGAELTAFISRRTSPQQADQLATAYHRFLLSFGGEKKPTSPLMANARVVMILDTYEVIFSRGPYIAGVREAADSAQAIALAVTLKRNLEKNASEK